MLEEDVAVFGEEVEEGVGTVSIVSKLLCELGHVWSILHVLHEGVEVVHELVVGVQEQVLLS